MSRSQRSCSVLTVMEFVLGGEHGGVWKAEVIVGKGAGGVCVESLENTDRHREWFGY